MAKSVGFTVAQAAAMLGLTVQRLYQMDGEGKLTFTFETVTRQEKRVTKAELDRVIAERAAKRAGGAS
jgi:hypothetical protein